MFLEFGTIQNELQAQLPALYAARQAEIEQLQTQPEVFYPDETVDPADPVA